MFTDSEHMHSLHVHTGVDSQHTRTQSTCMYVCLHTHRPHVCTQTRTRGRSPGRLCMSVCTRHKDVGWALPFSPVLPLQGAEQTRRVCQQLPADEGKHKPGRVVYRQESERSHLQGGRNPQMHVTCLSSWVSPWEMSGSLICS